MIDETNLQERARRLEHVGKVMSGATISVSDAIEAFWLDPALKAKFLALGAAIAKASALAVNAGRDLGIVRVDVDSGQVWVERGVKP